MFFTVNCLLRAHTDNSLLRSHCMKVLVVVTVKSLLRGRGSSVVERQTPYERSRVRTPQPLCSVLKLPQSNGKYPGSGSSIRPNMTEKVVRDVQQQKILAEGKSFKVFELFITGPTAGQSKIKFSTLHYIRNPEPRCGIILPDSCNNITRGCKTRDSTKQFV